MKDFRFRNTPSNLFLFKWIIINLKLNKYYLILGLLSLQIEEKYFTNKSEEYLVLLDFQLSRYTKSETLDLHEVNKM